MCPIPQGTPSLSLILTMIPLCACPIAHVSYYPYVKIDVKLSKRCQVVKKMSSYQKDVKCQKVKHMDYGGGSQKKKDRAYFSLEKYERSTPQTDLCSYHSG